MLSPFDAKKTKLKELIEKLSGGYIPGLIGQLSSSDLGRDLNVCDDHALYGC